MSFPIPPENTGPDSLNIVVERNEWIKIQHQLALAREALNKCHELFSEIKGDWADPRSQCREGWKVIEDTLAKLSEMK